MAVIPDGVWLRALVVEAVGDDFAQLSGVWFDGARVAAHVAGADRVWAFAALNLDDATEAYAALQEGAGKRIIGLLVPEARALLEDGVPEDATVGLLLSVDAPDCANCPGTCIGCHATNAGD